MQTGSYTRRTTERVRLMVTGVSTSSSEYVWLMVAEVDISLDCTSCNIAIFRSLDAANGSTPYGAVRDGKKIRHWQDSNSPQVVLCCFVGSKRRQALCGWTYSLEHLFGDSADSSVHLGRMHSNQRADQPRHGWGLESGYQKQYL